MTINPNFVSPVVMFLSWVLMIWSSDVDLPAQSSDPVGELKTVPSQPMDVREIEQTLRQLQAETDKLRTSLSNSNLPNSDTSSRQPGSKPAGSQIGVQRERESTPGPVLAKQKRDASQIHRQIELIKQMIVRQQAQSQERSQPSVPAVQGSPIFDSPQQQPADQADDASALFETGGAPQLPSQLPTTDKNPSNASQISSRSVRILPEPVDLFEMGNSLFETTDLGATLKAYDAIDRSSLNAVDATWLEYLTACCQQRLGDLETAESVFRQVSNENGHAKLIESSRWWLKQIGRKQMAKETMNQLEAEFTSLMERAGNHDPNRIK